MGKKKKETGNEVDWREARRLRAWEMLQQGLTQREIAEKLGVTQGAVSQWLKRVREGGVEALQRRKAPGATPRLSKAQREQLPALLERGPEAYGFEGPRWTRAEVAEVIKRTFGVSYHPSHVGRILRAMGVDLQEIVAAPPPGSERSAQPSPPEETMPRQNKKSRRESPAHSLARRGVRVATGRTKKKSITK